MKYPLVFKVVGEPSPFMDGKFKRPIRYFCTSDRAQQFARAFLRANPHGEALILTKKRRGT